MYVFRQTKIHQPLGLLASRLRRLCRTPVGSEGQLQILLAASGLECSLADFWGAERDGRTAGHRAALAMSLAAAEAHLRRHSALASRSDSVAAALAALAPYLPPRATLLPVSHPEGFRFYGLTPEAFIAPARNLARELGEAGIFVLGLRSIGSTLAAVVAAVLRQEHARTEWATVRPRGAPEDRYYAADSSLEDELRQWPGMCAIVDEGPGLSGSSFGGAVAWLRRLDIAAERIVLMPSWDPPAERLSHTVVARSWAGWRKYPATPLSPSLAVPSARGVDLSAGLWRQALGVPGPIPVWPQRERMKFLSRDGGSIFKFAGLAEYGREAAARARLLARAGFTAPADYVGDGWLRSPRLRFSPLLPAALNGLAPRWAEWAGRYLALLRAQFTAGPPQPPSPEMQLMVATNLRRLLAREMPLDPPEAPPVQLDGRVQPHEWGIHAGNFVKFDALDHGDDHFFPGPTDIAWDLAGLEFEFGPALGRAARQEYARRSGDLGIAARLPWYRIAYGSFQAAFAEFAQELVGPPDQAWFQAARNRYLHGVQLQLDG